MSINLNFSNLQHKTTIFLSSLQQRVTQPSTRKKAKHSAIKSVSKDFTIRIGTELKSRE